MKKVSITRFINERPDFSVIINDYIYGIKCRNSKKKTRIVTKSFVTMK